MSSVHLFLSSRHILGFYITLCFGVKAGSDNTFNLYGTWSLKKECFQIAYFYTQSFRIRRHKRTQRTKMELWIMYRSMYLLTWIKDCTTLEDLYLNWDYRFIVVSNILDLLIDGYAAKKNQVFLFFLERRHSNLKVKLSDAAFQYRAHLLVFMEWSDCSPGGAVLQGVSRMCCPSRLLAGRAGARTTAPPDSTRCWYCCLNSIPSLRRCSSLGLATFSGIKVC